MGPASEGSALTRDAWIEAAFAILIEKGVDGVRVQSLAHSLHVTRGSFYWHFQDVNDLLRSLLDRWFDRETRAIIEEVEASGGKAPTRLRRLLEACARDDGKIELAMRNWARSDERAKDVLRRVDETRIGYLQDLLCQVGHSAEAARPLASMAYLAWLGLYSSYAFVEQQERISQMRQLHAFLLTNAPG